AFGNYQTTILPDHSVGAYYFYFRTRSGLSTLRSIMSRLLRAVTTKYHLKNPWRVPPTLISEIRGLIWACRLVWGGPRYIRDTREIELFEPRTRRDCPSAPTKGTHE